MTDYLRRQATDLGLDNVKPLTATAVDLPLPDGSATVVVSNYVYHHLSDADKEDGIAEAFRVLRPGGRLVVGDMMFRPALADERSRRIIGAKVVAMLRRGPAGIWRLIKNAFRYVTGSWEQPADPEWWRRALEQAGFEQIDVQPLEHEGGIVSAIKPSG
jgi:ubiquinone/menaquinone biosynthesis C-methylase UbiE